MKLITKTSCEISGRIISSSIKKNTIYASSLIDLIKKNAQQMLTHIKKKIKITYHMTLLRPT
jgi:predicted transcriptional regulator